ncbi:MAG: hypothetical protein HRT44_10775, partial [Bdellovibrionales bacterium]|nr:hypothetical protein [Bdellovibrionales bacterium]NQZ19724.1 hypothetical protein [Bdellovibrionales bacterium]
KSKWEVDFENKKYQISSEKMLWWLQSVKNIELTPVAFNKDKLEDAWVELIVKSDKGRESVFFNKEGDQIYISSLKAIAHLDDFSLKSIEIELKKVLKSAE